ncbi:hypothetical protein JCM8208_001576 [Rhodotorula glutinis]
MKDGSQLPRLAVPALATGYEYAPLSSSTPTTIPGSPHLSSPPLSEPPATPWRTTFTPQHLKPPPSPLSPARARRTLPLALAAALVTLTLYLLAAPLRLSSLLDLARLDSHRPCTAAEWSSGAWVPKDPPLTPNATRVDVLAASGFKGVTQSWFKPAWFLHTKPGDWLEMGEDGYRWRAAQWRWEAGGRDVCRDEVGPTEGEALLRELVERGGWLIVGDSLAEQHFFSLGCVLFPHVYVVWGAGWQEQHMYLSPDSPLVASLALPPSFDLAKTPLVTNLRSDHGFTKPELVAIYESTPESAETPSAQLFTDYPVDSPPVEAYLSRFFKPENRYRALVFSTAAHFTPREFAFPAGQSAIGTFFAAVAQRWVDLAARYLVEHEHERGDGDGIEREVIVRGASSGHDACHERVGGPLNATERPLQESYNWSEIPRYNGIFADLVEKAGHPRLSYLSLERPSQLRPDAHSEDCLHYAVGTGVFEGWTDYIAYFLRSRWRGGGGLGPVDA